MATKSTAAKAKPAGGKRVLQSADQVHLQIEKITTQIRAGKFLSTRDAAAVTKVLTNFIVVILADASW